MGAVLGMVTARARRNAQRRLAPLHTMLQRFRYDNQVIYLCFHGLTIPPLHSQLLRLGLQ